MQPRARLFSWGQQDSVWSGAWSGKPRSCACCSFVPTKSPASPMSQVVPPLSPALLHRQHLTPTAPEVLGRLPPFLQPHTHISRFQDRAGVKTGESAGKCGGHTAFPADSELHGSNHVKGLSRCPPGQGFCPAALTLLYLPSSKGGMGEGTGSCSYQLPPSPCPRSPHKARVALPLQRWSALFLPASRFPGSPRSRARGTWLAGEELRVHGCTESGLALLKRPLLKSAPPNLRPSHPSTYSFTLAAPMAIRLFIVTPRAAS